MRQVASDTLTAADAVDFPGNGSLASLPCGLGTHTLEWRAAANSGNGSLAELGVQLQLGNAVHMDVDSATSPFKSDTLTPPSRVRVALAGGQSAFAVVEPASAADALSFSVETPSNEVYALDGVGSASGGVLQIAANSSGPHTLRIDSAGNATAVAFTISVGINAVPGNLTYPLLACPDPQTPDLGGKYVGGGLWGGVREGRVGKRRGRGGHGFSLELITWP